MGINSHRPRDTSPPSTGRRLYGAVEQRLGLAIITGQLSAGEILPPEPQFARELKIARTSYREAIRALVEKGLLERKPQSGTKVRHRDQWNLLDADMLGWALCSPVDPKYIRDLMSLRAIVIPSAAAAAAVHRNTSHLAELKRCLCEMRGYGYWTKAGENAEQNFLECLLRASGNELLPHLSAAITASITWTRRLENMRFEVASDLTRHYEEVRKAIHSRKPDQAASEMRHILETLDVQIAKSLPKP